MLQCMDEISLLLPFAVENDPPVAEGRREDIIWTRTLTQSGAAGEDEGAKGQGLFIGAK